MYTINGHWNFNENETEREEKGGEEEAEIKLESDWFNER